MAAHSISTFTALDSLRETGIVVASDGAEYNKIAQFNPVDATTNPSLVYVAVSSPEYSFLLEEAVRYAQSRIPSATVDEKTQLAMDRLLVQVGVQILALIPGRVSLSIDPRVGTSYTAILAKSRSLINILDELQIPRSRVLIKIPATAVGIHAAHTLQTQDGVSTNMTLVFSLVQALACAQAGLSVISPFIGRVKDWWSAREKANGNPEGLDNQPLSEHPGIQLVHRIREAFIKYGYTRTEVMAAGFRKPEEIVEIARSGKNGGVDLVTLPPELLDGLRNLPGEHGVGNSYTPSRTILGTLPETVPTYFTLDGPAEDGLKLFERDSAIEAISLDKVPEGLDKFGVDTAKLESLIRDLVDRETHLQSSKSSTSIPLRTPGTVGDSELRRRSVPVA